LPYLPPQIPAAQYPCSLSPTFLPSA
jgi:hypothetical protein